MRPCLLLAAALLAGCAGSGTRETCGPRGVPLVNASGLAVEQLYLGTGTPPAWGTELLGRAGLPAGAGMTLPLPGTGSHALRAVWANGRAVELQGVDGCATGRVIILDGGLRAE